MNLLAFVEIADQKSEITIRKSTENFDCNCLNYGNKVAG